MVAVVPYAVYYVGYHANRWSSRHVSYTRLSLVRCVFWGWQASGMAGEVAIDWVKGHTGFRESIYDEHQFGHLNLLHAPGPGRTGRPGLYKRGGRTHMDWAW